jgi:hypothetical protein
VLARDLAGAAPAPSCEQAGNDLHPVAARRNRLARAIGSR